MLRHNIITDSSRIDSIYLLDLKARPELYSLKLALLAQAY